MRVLNQQELKSIEYFFKLNQTQLLKAIKKYLKGLYEEVYASNKYIVAVGEIPIALVAHLDTVFKVPPQDIYYDKAKNVMWSPDGLGADDRAGVYAIVQILKAGFRPTVVFTTDEELGCIGSNDLIGKMPKAPTELKYIIQLDRRGSNDCVFYDCFNPDFNKYVEKFGFVTNFGSFSDISLLCPMWGVAGVNLSIGYYNEHSVSEILNIGQMFDTIKKVKNMLIFSDDADNFKYISKYYPKPKSVDLAYGWGYVDDDEWLSEASSLHRWCQGCGYLDYEYNMLPVKMPNGNIEYFCIDCLAENKNIYWCEKCGEAFLEKNNKSKYCEDCRGK